MSGGRRRPGRTRAAALGLLGLVAVAHTGAGATGPSEVVSARTDDSRPWSPPAGQVIRRTVASRLERASTLVERFQDDRAEPIRGTLERGYELDLVVRDTIVAADDDGVARFQRTIEAAQRVTFEGSAGVVDQQAWTSPLAGATVRFDREDSAEGWSRRFDDDGDRDEALLDGLQVDFDLSHLAPPPDLELGATWSVEGADLRALLQPAGSLAWRPEGREPTELEAFVDLAVEARWAATAGRLTLRYRGAAEVAGAPVDDFELTLELDGDGTVDEPLTNLDGRRVVRQRLVLEAEGRVRWRRDTGQLVDLTLAGRQELEEMIGFSTRRADGSPTEGGLRSIYEGTLHHSIETEVLEAGAAPEGDDGSRDGEGDDAPGRP